MKIIVIISNLYGMCPSWYSYYVGALCAVHVNVNAGVVLPVDAGQNIKRLSSVFTRSQSPSKANSLAMPRKLPGRLHKELIYFNQDNMQFVDVREKQVLPTAQGMYIFVCTPPCWDIIHALYCHSHS